MTVVSDAALAQRHAALAHANRLRALRKQFRQGLRCLEAPRQRAEVAAVLESPPGWLGGVRVRDLLGWMFWKRERTVDALLADAGVADGARVRDLDGCQRARLADGLGEDAVRCVEDLAAVVDERALAVAVDGCLPVSGRGFIPNAPIREVVLEAVARQTVEGVGHVADLIGCDEASLRRSLGLKDDVRGRVQTRMQLDRALLVLDVIGVFPVEVGL